MRRSSGIVILVICVWSILYLPHLRTSPSWYGDETLTLMIGRSLYSGEGADRAIHATFWHPSYAYQPGYAWLVGVAAARIGGDLLGARLLNTLLALSIALTLYFIGRRALGSKIAIFAALTFLTYSQTVIHFRWIYPHNAVALGFAITCLFLLKKSSMKTDMAAGGGLALAAVSHPLFMHGALAACLCRIKRPWAWLRMAIIPLIATTGCLVWTLARQSPNTWVFDDIALLAGFYGKFSEDNGSGFQFILNVFTFYTQDIFHVGAFLAALICCNKRFYIIPIFLAVVSGLLLQNRQNLPVFYYQAIVFLPIMTMAWAGAASTVQLTVRAKIGNSKWINRGLTALLLLPAFQFLQIVGPAISGKLIPRNQFWCTQNIQEVETAATWLNERLKENDLVVCHQNIGWLLKSRTTDLMQATAWTGRTTFTFEKHLSRDRFLYAADLFSAKFVVLGDIDQRWTLGQPNVRWVLEEVSNNKWPIVWRGQNYMILENPGI